MKIYLKSITPVFISSGKEYEPFDYVKHKDTLYFIDSDKIFSKIIDKYPDAPDKLVTWIKNYSEKIINEKDNKKQSLLRSSFNILNFIANELKDSNLENLIVNDLLSFSKYKIEKTYIGNKKIILQSLKNPHYHFYIPGSSIKGSIRTALLYNIINKFHENEINLLIKKIKSEIDKISKLDKNNKKREKNRFKASIGDLIEREAFYCGVERRINGKSEISYTDEKFDLMKLVHISDSNTVSVSENGTISVIDLFTYRSDETQSQTPAIEAIKQGTILNFNISINLNYILKAKQLLKEQGAFGKKIWIKFQQKLERLFDISLENLCENNLKEYENKIINNIFKIVNEFYKEVKLQEMRTAVSKAKRKVIKTQELKDFYDNNLTDNLMKIGYGTGFLGVTVFLAMLKNQSLKTIYDKILKFLNIGRPQKIPEDWVFNIDLFPVSRRYDNQPDMLLPLGWLRFSFDEDEIRNFNIAYFPISSVNYHIGSDSGQTTNKPSKPSGIQAEIIEDEKKPVMIKLLEGEYANKELPLGNINLAGLNLKKGSKIFVELHLDNKKNITKVEYKGKVE